MESYTIETLLDGAAMSFEWRFDGLADGRTRLTQNIALTGECAANYREQVESAFTASLADGMKRIAEAMGRAQAGGGAGRRESGP